MRAKRMIMTLCMMIFIMMPVGASAEGAEDAKQNIISGVEKLSEDVHSLEGNEEGAIAGAQSIADTANEIKASADEIVVNLTPKQPSQKELNADKFGILTLLPPFIAIVLAFITKNVVLSLFVGALSGTFLISLADANFLKAAYMSFILFTEKALASLADSWNAGIILQVLAIGGLIALVGKMGGAKAVAESLAKKAKSPVSAQIITWVLGLLVFFDDYANSLIVGPIMRPVTDKMKVSREKLAFIVDATAAPIAGIVLVSTWVGYEMSLIKDAYIDIGQLDVNAFDVFIQTIPYRFYNIFMLAFVVFGAVMLREFGPMAKAEKRARTTGKVLSDTAKPMVSDETTELDPDEGTKLSVWNAIIPIGTLIVCSLGGFYFNGLSSTDTADLTGSFLQDVAVIFGNSDASIVIFQAALFAGVVAIVMGAWQKIFTVKDGIDVWVKGLKSLIITGVILILAWSLSSTIKELGTSYYLVENLKDSLPTFLLPTLIFILGSVISFATGTSYGTMGILMPLAIPLAANIGGGDPQFIIVSTAAVLTGAILGDHCSPISDTTILSSMGAACDHLDHTKTQLPYAVAVGIASIIFGYIPAGLGINGFILLPIGIVLVGVCLRIFGQKVDEA